MDILVYNWPPYLGRVHMEEDIYGAFVYVLPLAIPSQVFSRGKSNPQNSSRFLIFGKSLKVNNHPSLNAIFIE
jgi:hypothetical protein